MRDWTKYAAVAIAGCTMGASLLGVAKCTDLQTVQAAQEFELEMKQEHREFRATFKEINQSVGEVKDLVRDKVELILERLPAKE